VAVTLPLPKDETMFYAVRIKDIPLVLLFCLIFFPLMGFAFYVLDYFHGGGKMAVAFLVVGFGVSLAAAAFIQKQIVRWVAYLDRLPPKPIRKEDEWGLSPLRQARS
jgi:hypothetical protein